ncbi:cytochrome P450 [Fusarium flagelliforme]|uniref:cytochrome P450 n=1 Tax=Fusarium flagelliforme TaxID=2675880 RepID=UPI001E8DAFA4|nr:cytochrome P450 [Fusarium flagelliforme]KAH7192845.1 cytochrome P450 [Fusarium flagelliforme]
MIESWTLLVSICVGLVAYIGLRLISNGSKRPPLPPGPKGLPLLGNLNDLPPPGVVEAFHWLKHKDLYGPISSVTVMGQTIVIINDAKLAFDLLDKRSVKHSSRPTQVFAGEMIGWDKSLALSGYNDRFRTHRKNMARIIGSKTAAAQYDTLQEAEVSHFLLHVLDHPEHLTDHIRKEAGAVILKIAYGYTAEPFKEDPLISMAGKAMDDFGVAAVPGAFLVDILPFLRHVPDWVPVAGFKRLARQWASELHDVTEKPYAFVQHQIAHGKQDNSFLAQLLEAGDETAEEKLTNKWSAASLYVAGADTTVSSIACFFLAMSLSPDVVRKAQEEVDRVIGNDRLPNSMDRPNLPYVEAVVKEVLRWHPVAPMGLPHTSTTEDVFEGYLIPKGSMVIANIWHFAHDPEVYNEPMTFKPERFLPTDGTEPEQDPHAFVFGFGRRVCPGRVLADNALFLNMAQSLAVFNITKNKGDTKEVSFTPGIVSHPSPFQASITPRSAHHERLIRSLEQKHPWETSDSHILDSMKS